MRSCAQKRRRKCRSGTLVGSGVCSCVRLRPVAVRSGAAFVRHRVHDVVSTGHVMVLGRYAVSSGSMCRVLGAAKGLFGILDDVSDAAYIKMHRG